MVIKTITAEEFLKYGKENRSRAGRGMSEELKRILELESGEALTFECEDEKETKRLYNRIRNHIFRHKEIGIALSASFKNKKLYVMRG